MSKFRIIQLLFKVKQSQTTKPKVYRKGVYPFSAKGYFWAIAVTRGGNITGSVPGSTSVK